MPLGKPLLEALDRMGYGGLVLDSAGQVLNINPVGRGILEQSCEAVPQACTTDYRTALKSLLRSKSSARFRLDEQNWVVVRRDHLSKRPLIIHAVPIAEQAISGPHTVVILVNLDVSRRPTRDALQRIFDLTPTEAKLAIEVGAGISVDDIAGSNGVAVGTVRKQLASVFAKTNTHRQAELVALLAQVSILP